MDTRISTIAFALALALLASCKESCTDSEWQSNGEKIVRTYPDCNDLTYFRRQQYHTNGRLASDGYFRNRIEEGKFRSWAPNGNQTAEWEMLDGKEHGFIQCWYDDGTKKKEITLNRGIENGLEKTWYPNGSPRSIGFFLNGKRQGIWKTWNADGIWELKTYHRGVLSGPVYEEFIDSLGTTILVTGQFKDGKEDGVWKWFTRDSLMRLSVEYAAGIQHGELVDFNSDGSVKGRSVYENGVLRRNGEKSPVMEPKLK